MNGKRVGVWSPPVSGSSSFRYELDWIEASEGRVLSLSLPFTPGNVPHAGKVVASFFDNLLPDSDAIRRRIKARFGTAATEPFDLLAAVGRECVGAVQLLPDGETSKGFDRITGDKLDEAGVEQAIDAALSNQLFAGQSEGDDFRISIAGAQEKTALLFHQGHWWLPHGMTPTTHIFKLPLGIVGNLRIDMQDSVENEWLCSRLMNAFGLETAACEILQFGTRKVLVVERFDRRWMNRRWIARLPQEDLCQALGVAGENKYENQGGPGVQDILRVLDASSRAAEDKRAFVKAQLVFWLLAATDGHAKNFSIFHEQGGTYRLTPFYDVLSAWPVMGHGAGLLDIHKAELAMALRGKSPHRRLLEIQPRHFDWAARLAGLGDASGLIREVITQIPKVIAQVRSELPKGFPVRVRDSIFAGIRQQPERLVSKAPGQQR
jgi:serine/threonine-protein kinase HipA